MNNNKKSQTDCLHPLNIERELFKSKLIKEYKFVLLDDNSWEILFDFYLERTTHFSYSYESSENKDEKIIAE